MIRNIPVADPVTGERSILQGETTDRLSFEDGTYIDSETGQPFEGGTPLAAMPANHMVHRVPRLTWHAERP